MSEAKTFQVNATPEGRWWVFEIPELDTGGQATSLASVEREAVDVAALWLDIDAATVAVEVNILDVGDARAAWADSELAAASARQAQAAAAESRRRVVIDLTQRRGFSAADAGRILGVSTQRVYQLTSGSARSGESKVEAAAGERLTRSAGQQAVTAGRDVKAATTNEDGHTPRRT